MENNKKLKIEGTKKKKILVGVQILIIIFMLVFMVIGKHVFKIEDSIITKVIFICTIAVIVIMNIITLKENDDEEKDNETKK